MEKVLLLIYIFPLLLSALLGVVLALFVLRNRLTPSSIALLVLILGAALWSFGYALEFLSPALDTKLFWAKFQYFGIASVPLAWFVFAFRYLGSSGWLARPLKYRALLGVIPIATLGLVWTNQLHHLIWQDVRLHSLGSVQILEFRHGPAFWIYLVFSYALLLAGSVKLGGCLLDSIRQQRRQSRLALLGVLIPWFGNLIYITGLNPVKYLDWTPFAFIIAGLLFTISLFRYQLIEILPIAEKTIFAGLPDCLLVLDAQDFLVDLNQAAQEMLGCTDSAPLGEPFNEIMPELADWIAQAGINEEFRAEIVRGEQPDQKFYDLRVIPLYGPYSRPVGRLVVCHETTLQRQQHALLEQAVVEQTRELQQAVEQLENELTQRTLAERRFEEVVESAPDAMLLVDQDGSILLVNVQAERLFGYSRQELLSQDFENLVPKRRRKKLREYGEQLVANPSQTPTSLSLELSARRKDGQEFPVEISLGGLETSRGVWVACTIRDISRRMQSEQAQKRLLEEIKQSHQQLRALAFHLQEVQEYERHQIARELHDRVGQNLTGLNLNLQIVQNKLNPDCKAEVQDRLVDALKLVEETTRQVRDVMIDLHPPMLDEFGLVAALQTYGGIFSQRTGIDTRVNGAEIVPRLPANVEMVLFRLIQESLHNVAKHAQATRAVIQIESNGDELSVRVKDNGQGFDPQALDAPTEQPHWGMIDMQQRAESIGAELSIVSTPGEGTEVSIFYWR